MSKRKSILWLGVMVALMPFLGFPSSWKTFFYVLAGAFIAWNSYQLNKHKTIRARRIERKPKPQQGSPVSEAVTPTIENPRMVGGASEVSAPPSKDSASGSGASV